MPNPAGAFFGKSALEAFITANTHLRAEGFAVALLQHLKQWSRRGAEGRPFDDDLTLVVVDVTA